MQNPTNHLTQNMIHLGALLRTYEDRLSEIPGVGIATAEAQVVTGQIYTAEREVDQLLRADVPIWVRRRLGLSPADNGSDSKTLVIRVTAYVLHVQLFPVNQHRTTLLHEVMRVARVVALSDAIESALTAKQAIESLMRRGTLRTKRDSQSWEPPLSLDGAMLEYFLGGSSRQSRATTAGATVTSVGFKRKGTSGPRSVEELKERDKRLWQLATYDASRGWRVPQTEDGFREAHKFLTEYKRLICTGEMTLAELEESVYGKHNPDLQCERPPLNLEFADEEPDRHGHFTKLDANQGGSAKQQANGGSFQRQSERGSKQ